MEFETIEPLSGKLASELSMIAVAPGACRDQAARVGERYLVIGTDSVIDGARNVICNDLIPEHGAYAQIAYFRLANRGDTPTEVTGSVLITGTYKAVPSVQIHLSGREGNVDLVSDEKGRFQSSVKPGRYHVEANLPVGYEAEYCGPQDFEAVAHKCVSVTICSQPTASIAAHIRDVDGSLFDVTSGIQLTLATAKENNFVRSVWPNETSTLTADHLLPGTYVLGLNTYLPVDSGSAPYPPTYYPGVPDRSDAYVINLTAGEQKVLPEMLVKKGSTCEIPVTVTDSEGRPSPQSAVALAYPGYPNFWASPNHLTDKNGKLTVYAVFPGPVLLRAEMRRNDGSGMNSEVRKIYSCPVAPVLLKLVTVIPASSAHQK